MSKKYEGLANTVTIGMYRDDGDFHIHATLNNNDQLMGRTDFQYLVTSTRDGVYDNLKNLFDNDEIVILERQDTPDYVFIHEEDSNV